MWFLQVLQSKVLIVTVPWPLKMPQVLSACSFPPLSFFLCFHLYSWRLVTSLQVQSDSPEAPHLPRLLPPSLWGRGRPWKMLCFPRGL